MAIFITNLSGDQNIHITIDMQGSTLVSRSQTLPFLLFVGGESFTCKKMQSSYAKP